MSLSVVVVEQHHAAREGLVVLLEERGFTVAAATGSGRAGVELIERHAPDLTLVGVGWGDPNANGFALAREALHADPGRRILLYSSPGDALLEVLALVGGGGVKAPDPAEPPDVRSLSGALSRREGQVLELLARGMTGEQVAEHLVLSAETVRTHVRNAMGKLRASTRVHAVAIALREGYIEGPQPAPAPAPAP